MTTAQPEATTRPSGLPLGVYLLAGLRVLDAALLGAAAAGVRPIAGEAVLEALVPSVEVLHVIFAITAVLSVTAAVLLLLGHRWGWAGAMMLTGLELLFAIYAFQQGSSTDLRMILLVGSAFYLNQRVVRERFWGSPR